ncbi:MAG: AtpZ/AtpI family protein [Burkholderiaceae bacterium]|nr:AtpZ/AtpI family protein [Burkholderiaceae bacterium]
MSGTAPSQGSSSGRRLLADAQAADARDHARNDSRDDGTADGTADDGRLRAAVERRVQRIAKAERERSSLLAQSVYMGTIAGLIVVPVVAGAYLGRWLDERIVGGYSVRWTIGLLLAGVLLGAINVYLFVRERH